MLHSVRRNRLTNNDKTCERRIMLAAANASEAQDNKVVDQPANNVSQESEIQSELAETAPTTQQVGASEVTAPVQQPETLPASKSSAAVVNAAAIEQVGIAESAPSQQPVPANPTVVSEVSGTTMDVNQSSLVGESSNVVGGPTNADKPASRADEVVGAATPTERVSFRRALKTEFTERDVEVTKQQLDGYVTAYQGVKRARNFEQVGEAFSGINAEAVQIPSGELGSALAATGENTVFFDEDLSREQLRSAAREEVAELAYQQYGGGLSEGDFGQAVQSRVSGNFDADSAITLRSNEGSGDTIEVDYQGNTIVAEAKNNTRADKNIGKVSGIGKRFLDTKQLFMVGGGTGDQVVAQAKEYVDRFTDNTGTKATGIRVPIFFDGQDFGQGTRYDAVQSLIKHADSKGLEIYANPAGVGADIPGTFRNNNAKYANRLKDFVRDNPQVDYLGPFNESSFSTSKMTKIMDNLKKNTGEKPNGDFNHPKIPGSVDMVGPDNKLLKTTLNYINNRGLVDATSQADRDKFKKVDTDGEKLLKKFDIIGTHNLFDSGLGRGRTGTVSEFETLKKWGSANGLKVWDSEALESNKNRSFDNPNDAEKANRLSIASQVGVDGVVLYEESTNRADYSSDDQNDT